MERIAGHGVLLFGLLVYTFARLEKQQRSFNVSVWGKRSFKKKAPLLL